VRIYNAGKLRTASNSVLNGDGRAEQLLYFSSYVSAGPSDLGIELRSNSTAAGLFYAPQATYVHASNAELFGSVVAGQARIASNGFFHYDEALAGLRLPPTLLPSWYVPVALHEVR